MKGLYVFNYTTLPCEAAKRLANVTLNPEPHPLGLLDNISLYLYCPYSQGAQKPMKALHPEP